MSIKAALSAVSWFNRTVIQATTELHLQESLFLEMSCHSHSIRIRVENWKPSLGIYREFLSKLTPISLGKYLREPVIRFVSAPLWCVCVRRTSVCSLTKTTHPVALRHSSPTLTWNDCSGEIWMNFLPFALFFGITVSASRSNLNYGSPFKIKKILIYKTAIQCRW